MAVHELCVPCSERYSEAFLVNVPRSVLVSDGDMDYKLLHAHNIPVLDESMLEFSILEDNDRKLNFILELATDCMAPIGQARLAAGHE